MNSMGLADREGRRWAYPLAFLITAVVTALMIAMNDWLEIPTIVLLYLLPVGASAALWGLWPGVFSAILSFFSLNYFFIPPYGTLMVHKSQDILMLIVFLGLAISISQLVGRTMESLAIARARENETNRLYELSLTFSKLHRDVDILNQLVRHTFETFHADQVEIFVEDEKSPTLIRLPEKSTLYLPASRRPDVHISLQGSQQFLGEIRVWREGHPFTSDEERLLQTFVRQGILALERAQLSASESRARILEESDRMKSALLSSVSHELRTPLASITGALSSLLDNNIVLDHDSQQSLLETASEEADRLNRLVGNLLDMTRLEAGAMHIKREACDVQDVIGSALEELKHQLMGRTVAIDLPEDLPLVQMDFVLIERVLVNLIDNALKNSPVESTIEIAASMTESNLLINVSDHGPGISDDDLEHIFEKFHHTKQRNRAGGIGLGLSICKGIVQAHGGKIWAENRTEGGTSIIFALPV